MPGQAGDFSQEELRTLELMEKNIDEYLDEKFDPIERLPVLIESTVIYSGVSFCPPRVANRLIQKYTTPEDGWKVDGYHGKSIWEFIPK